MKYPQPWLAVIVLEIVKRVVSHIIFTLYANLKSRYYMLDTSSSSSYQDLRCRRTETTHQEWVGRSESRCSLNVQLATRWERLYGDALAFALERNISSIRLNYYTFDDLKNVIFYVKINNCCTLNYIFAIVIFRNDVHKQPAVTIVTFQLENIIRGLASKYGRVKICTNKQILSAHENAPQHSHSLLYLHRSRLEKLYALIRSMLING